MTVNGPSQERFSLAVIEGFYGRLWSEADRLALAPFARDHSAFLGRLADGMRATALVRDLTLLQDKDLDHLSNEERGVLTKTYGARRTPYAHEIVDWLDGVYAFDPACLTD